jgi:hypothetical protein
MGNPRFYWYPEGATSFETIQLPHVSAVAVAQFRDVVDAEGLTMTRLDRGGGRLVTIRGRYNTANHANVIRALQTLDAYLRYGGRVAFAIDSAKAYMAPLVMTALPGTQQIFTDANVLPFTAGGVTLANNDEIEIQVTNPLRYERAVVTSAVATTSGYNLTLGRGLYNFQPQNAIVRTQYTFPTLYMDATGSNGSTRWLDDTRHPGLIYEMDLTLVELPWEVAAMLSGELATGNLQIGSGGLSINQQISSTDFGSSTQTNQSTDSHIRTF